MNYFTDKLTYSKVHYIVLREVVLFHLLLSRAVRFPSEAARDPIYIPVSIFGPLIKIRRELLSLIGNDIVHFAVQVNIIQV